jgi:FKBP-type peptidyl-prolyl cis-trans isomerase
VIQQEIKTKPWQRIVAIAVAIVLLISTFGIYIGLVLKNDNGNPTDSSLSTNEQERYYELMAEYQALVAAQAEELSSKHFDDFVSFKSEVRAFNAVEANADDVTYRDLRIGDGEEVTEDFTDYSAYYIGWLSDETVFDSSFNDAANPTSLLAPLPGGNMIEGWNIGIIGMRIGGVREITIPSELAYKDEERGSIPANSPLKFIVMLIPPVEEIEPSEELLELYNKMASGYTQ